MRSIGSRYIGITTFNIILIREVYFKEYKSLSL